MRIHFKIFVTLMAFFPVFRGNPLEPTQESTVCGENWFNYKNDKCLIILDRSYRTQKEAENACRSLPWSKTFARLVTIKTNEQHLILHQFLSENWVSDSIWIGLKLNKSSGEYEWNDGSELVYNNLLKTNASGSQNQCVEMNNVGIWIAVVCSKKNIAVCESDSTWPMAALQNQKPEMNETEWERKINQSEKDCEEKIMKSERKTELLKEAADKTLDLLKEATEQLTDLEHNDEPIQEIGYREPTASKHGVSSVTVKNSTRCGDWIPYRNEKCYKIADRDGRQTQLDAENICEAYSEGAHRESNPRLLTIKTKGEQMFLQQFLFAENQITNNVWLGLKTSNGREFEWHDGSQVFFSKWINQSVADNRHYCAEMESGLGINAVGLWARVSCKKENVVVCERTQTWTLGTLQNAFLNSKMEHKFQKHALDKEIASLQLANHKSEREFNELKQASEREISSLKQANKASQLAYESLKQSSEREFTYLKKQIQLPIGFIYVQLPTQQTPNELWPLTNWTDISSNYSGLFFRVVGGAAAPFGQIQEGNSSRLEEVERGTSSSNNRLIVPSDGSWSQQMYVASSYNPNYHSLRFRLSSSEVRPRNQAVKIWKRMQ